MPKPNTRFLRHIIKDTDTHNKALLAKEAAESKARLEDLEHTEEVKRLKTNPNNKDIRRRQMGDIRAILGGKRPRTETDDDAAPSSSRRGGGGGGGGEKKDREEEGRRRGRASRGESTAGGDLFTARDDERRRHGRLRTDDDNEDSRSHRREKRSSRRKDNDDHRGGSDRRRRHRRDRSRSRSASQSCDRDRRRRSRSPGEAGRKRRHRHRSPVRESKSSRAGGRETNDGDGSEVSDASQDDLIGPAPPPVIRGRGRLAGASGIDRRFSESYDPRADVQMEDEGGDGGGDGSRWDNDVEAFRDRQKLRQAQDERLRSAGFDEGQIQRARGASGGGQKRWDVDDVKWTKAGEQREWDRGKDLSDEEL